MNPKQRLIEVKNEITNLRNSLATAPDSELDAIEARMTALENEKASLEKRIKLIDSAKRSAMSMDIDDDDDDQPEDPVPSARSAASVVASSGSTDAEVRAAKSAEAKKERAASYKKLNRTVVLDSDVLIPKHQSNALTGFPFNQVSNILDAVNYLPVITGETYEEPYVIETGMADYTDQPSSAGTGGEYHEVGIDWDSVKIVKTKITAYSEITKELEKTPAANYADAVEANVTVSLKKKLAREIVVGDGAEGHFTGIMSSAVKANTVTDFDLGVINENTLDELILNYGGDEDIESKMALLLNKLTLLEFSRVRGADKRKVYTINYENGTIDGIKFFTSSHVKDFANAGVGDAVMAYGDFNQYRVAVFSNIETARSEHYKFRQGITAFRGDVFMGGNVKAYKAFSRVFKAASSVTKLTKKTGV
jgi:HK97 family phage major capsid protein